MLRAVSDAPVLRRKCACGATPGPTGECEQCRRKRLQRSASAPAPAVAPPAVHEVLRSPGAPLDASVRARMEPRFRHSFGDVRVHADGRAAESARAVGAHAYAVGPHVVFGAGRYAPGSADGERLIAHELAHVVQGRGAASVIQPKLEIGAADDAAEREADAAARAVVDGGPAGFLAAGGAALRRSPLQDDMDPLGLGGARPPGLGGGERLRPGPIGYREAHEYTECLRIMGAENTAYCRQVVLGIRAPAPPAAAPAAPVTGQDIGAELLGAIEEGRMATSDRELRMLRQLRDTGTAARGRGDPRVALSPELIALLHALQEQTPAPAEGGRAGFSMLSLVRGEGRHGRGEAVDIDRYGGHSIHIRNRAETIEGVIAAVEALPAGCYALGLPRTPRTDTVGAATDARRYPYIYEGTPPRVRAGYAAVAANPPFLPAVAEADIGSSPTHGLRGDLNQVADAAVRARLRAAIEAAQARGAQFRYLFPDAMDHLHIQVMTGC
jgi:hypothetical protein